jgi:hypothetical protein
MNKKTSDPQYSYSETDGIKLLVKVQMDHNYQLNIYLFIYLFIYSNCILHPYGSSNYKTKASKHI